MRIIVNLIRFLVLTFVYFCTFAVVSGLLLSMPAEQAAPAEPGTALLALLAVSVINTAVFTYIIRRSHWTGWKLVVSIFFVFYGVTTLMPQIETAFFVTHLPPGMLPRLFLAGAIIAAVFSPLAVLILGKVRSRLDNAAGPSLLRMPVAVWVAKLGFIVIAYEVIYFTFGYFIAWKNPAVRAYYGGSDPRSFIDHLVSLLRDQPSLFLLQAARALLWTAIAVPVIKMMKGEWWESGLAVALLFAAVNSQLLLPNPLMPYEVRMAHLLETATSNFLFGWLIVIVLRKIRPKSV
jgi:hypothetical protein